VSPIRRKRLSSWLTVVVRTGGDGGAPPIGRSAQADRLFLTAAALLTALAVLLPADEAPVYVHDRGVVARDFGCLSARLAHGAAEPRRAAPGPAPSRGSTATSPRPVAGPAPEGVEIDVDEIGRVTFPPGLSDSETIAGIQAMVVAHHSAGHGPHDTAWRAPRTPPPEGAAAAPGAAEAVSGEAVAEAERTCAIGRRAAPAGATGRPERFARRAWRDAYAGEPPSARAELAATRATVRSVLALLAAALLPALRAWWRWLRRPA
jgi:hypothetical protein